MHDAINNITSDSESFIMLLIFGVSGVVGVVAITLGVINSIFATKHREESRREIAAYIAEGSMSPEDGERLMNAGGPKKCGKRAS